MKLYANEREIINEKENTLHASFTWIVEKERNLVCWRRTNEMNINKAEPELKLEVKLRENRRKKDKS